MTPPWIAAAAAAGLIAGPRIRASVFFRAVGHGQSRRRACPGCARDILPGRHQPGALARAALGAAALTGFYLLLFVIRPGASASVTC